MKLNDRSKSTMALYRLFIVSSMLKNAKIAGKSKGTPHDYPKMMYTQMLSMAYWSSKNLPPWRFMQNNMCLFNEEMGETYYSILSRCVLGDNIKSDFDHMNKMFKLLPLYKEVKEQTSSDSSNAKFSISWHHTIPADCDEVNATTFFFKRMFRNMAVNRYKSYTYMSNYPTQVVCLQSLTRAYVPMVFTADMTEQVNELIAKITKALRSKFLKPHMNDWPFAPQHNDDSDDDDEGHMIEDGEVDNVSSPSRRNRNERKTADVDEVWGPPWEECAVGRFAVVRCKIGTPPLFGVCVIKVSSKADEVFINGECSRLLCGKEYNCTVTNTDPRCIRHGRWHLHRQGSTIDEYDNYQVIAYFDDLQDKTGVLPTAVMQAVELSDKSKPVFGIA